MDTSHGGCPGQAPAAFATGTTSGKGPALGAAPLPPPLLLVRTQSTLPECPWPRGLCSAQGPRRRVLLHHKVWKRSAFRKLERHRLESCVCTAGFSWGPPLLPTACAPQLSPGRKVPCQALRGCRLCDGSDADQDPCIPKGLALQAYARNDDMLSALLMGMRPPPTQRNPKL